MTYACRDRLPFAESFRAQDGWELIGVLGIQPRIVSVPFRMSKLCEYAKNDKYSDPQCVGCKWKQPKGEQ